MTRHDPTLSARTIPDPIREGTVDCLRRWGPCPDRTHAAFADRYGDQATRVLQAFRPLALTLMRYARRPLTRHAPGCPCRDADEATLAHLVCAAATQQREEAMLIALSLVRPDRATVLVAQAEALGLTLYSEHLGASRATHQPVSSWLN